MMKTALLKLQQENTCPQFLLITSIVCMTLGMAFCTPSNAQDGTKPKNSTRKIRVKPNGQSARIGTAINWMEDFESAERKSKESGKPIFWYVPTLSGSFMDRKPEINRYMLAGPFSWPIIIETINKNYIPVRVKPSREHQKKYQLLPYKFVEPGFLILEPDGTERKKIDRITTMHTQWFHGLLNSEQPNEGAKPKVLEEAWLAFRKGDYKNAGEVLSAGAEVIAAASKGYQCEYGLLQGMILFREGDHVAANEMWNATSQKYPDHPLAWKASAEAQGIGPFCRGFEVFSNIPAKALKSGVESEGSAAPNGTYTEKNVWQNGTKFLIGMQNQDGGFTDSDYDFGGTDSLPNVHVAVTSLAGMCLLESLERSDTDDGLKPAIISAIKRAIDYVSDDSHINKFDRDEILWAYAYRVRFLARCVVLSKRVKAESKIELDVAKLNGLLQKSVVALEGVQSERGGWYHEYNNPFVTATALSALKEGSASGARVNQSKIQRGLSSLAGDRFGNGAFPYGSRGKSGKGTDRDVQASAGRMPLCELGLWSWGKSSDEALLSAIQRSFAHHDNLDIALKYDDHTSRLSYGGFFFWYDMRGRSEAIQRIQDPVIRRELQAKQKAIILTLPELDGCFVDSHELGRVYGTSMALLSLANCDERNVPK